MLAAEAGVRRAWLTLAAYCAAPPAGFSISPAPMAARSRMASKTSERHDCYLITTPYSALKITGGTGVSRDAYGRGHVHLFFAACVPGTSPARIRASATRTSARSTRRAPNQA